MSRSFAACVALAAMLGGCTVGPDFRTPPPPDADRYRHRTPVWCPLASPSARRSGSRRNLGISRRSTTSSSAISRQTRLSRGGGLRAAQQAARAQRAALFPSTRRRPACLRRPTTTVTYTGCSRPRSACLCSGVGAACAESAEAQAEAQCFQLEATSLTLTSNVVVAGIAARPDRHHSTRHRCPATLKYEDIYLKGYADGREAKLGIAQWVAFYNHASERPSGYVVEANKFC